MNALELQFDADCFDYVMGFHTASVVDNPRRLMEEMVRVCTPGGTIVIINYFPTEHAWLSPVVNAASWLTKWLGWHMHVKYDDLFDHPEIRVQQRYKTSPLSFFTVVVSQRQVLDESGALPSSKATKQKIGRHTSCTR
jgi:phosphatidylethanolamine/phosphatidyl-N-methylethanolamine N-methyltransferase